MGRGKRRRSKKFGAILNTLYGRGSRLLPLPIVPRELSAFDYCCFYWNTQREPGLWAKVECLCVCHDWDEYVFLKINLIIMLPRLKENYLSDWKFSSSPNNKLVFIYLHVNFITPVHSLILSLKRMCSQLVPLVVCILKPKSTSKLERN